MIEDTMFDYDCYAVFLEKEHEKGEAMDDTISRTAAMTMPVLPKEHRDYISFELDDIYEQGWNECQSFIAKLPSAQPEQKWIPCSERLPEPNRHDALNVDVYYLAQTEFGDMIVASYNESHEGTKWWEQMYSYRIFDDEIVAWMLLPEPWRPGND